MNTNNFDNYYRLFLLFSFLFAFIAVVVAAFYKQPEIAGCFALICVFQAAGAYVLKSRKED